VTDASSETATDIQCAAQFAAEYFPMIDRSESDLIAREQRNRGETRTRRLGSRTAHDSMRAQRIEPTIGVAHPKPDPNAPPSDR